MTGNKIKLINYLVIQDDKKEFTLTEKKKRRSLDQNSYYWQLLNELAQIMSIPSETLHFELIKKSCPFMEIMIPSNQEIKGIRYYEILRTIKRDDKLFDIIRVYAGSSELNSKEFSILLDSLIEECKEQGIETLTPDELERLKYYEKSNQ